MNLLISPYPPLSFIVFILLSLPLVRDDLFSMEIKPFWLVILFTGVSVSIAWDWFNSDILIWRVLVSGIILLVGGLVWKYFPERFGLGDVLYISILALNQNPFNLYFTILTACLAGFLFYGYYLVKNRSVDDLPLPFIPVLYLAYLYNEVPHWLRNESYSFLYN